MLEAMPEWRGQELEVSPEEEALLRSAFRRYALPYLAGTMALAVAGVGLALAVARPAPDSASRVDADLVEGLRAEAEALRQKSAALEGRIGAVEAKTASAVQRLGALEGRTEALAQRPTAGAPDPAVANLARELRQAEQRVAALEDTLHEDDEATAGTGGSPGDTGSVRDALERAMLERLNDLEDRVQRFERTAGAADAPAAAATPAAPSP